MHETHRTAIKKQPLLVASYKYDTSDESDGLDDSDESDGLDDSDESDGFDDSDESDGFDAPRFSRNGSGEKVGKR